MAARPADKTHPYGYGKIENLSALAETLLLLVTCGWIVREAVERLFFEAPQIKPSWWGVGIILISFLVDVNRAAMLRRVAKKHKSQALEADALHFTTDIWSSGVVLVGLLCVQLSTFLPDDSPFRGPLHMADAIAALAVSGIVVVVGFQLSRRAVESLLDGGGREHAEKLEKTLAEKMPQYPVRRLRIRESGAEAFMDLTVGVPATLRLDAAHDVACRIEDLVHGIVPAADVTVHVEPEQEAADSVLQLARSLAAEQGLSIHNLILSAQGDAPLLYLHVEAAPDMSLSRAHAAVTCFEKALGERLNKVHIESHIEPDDRLSPTGSPAIALDLAVIRAAIDGLLPSFPGVSNVHDLRVTPLGGTPLVSFHCTLEGDPCVAEAHDLASAMEHALKQRLPQLERVLIHTDPLDGGDAC